MNRNSSCFKCNKLANQAYDAQMKLRRMIYKWESRVRGTMDRPITSKRQFHMPCNTGLYFQCSMFLDNVKLFKNKCHHILDMLPDFFSPCKRIDMCRKFSIILVSITRPNSTKNITCSNICDFPNQIICTRILSYKTVVSSFTLRCKSTRQQFPLQMSRKHALSVFEVNKCPGQM